jgi:hypothetical protein
MTRWMIPSPQSGHGYLIRIDPAGRPTWGHSAFARLYDSREEALTDMARIEQTGPMPEADEPGWSHEHNRIERRTYVRGPENGTPDAVVEVWIDHTLRRAKVVVLYGYGSGALSIQPGDHLTADWSDNPLAVLSALGMAVRHDPWRELPAGGPWWDGRRWVPVGP